MRRTVMMALTLLAITGCANRGPVRPGDSAQTSTATPFPSAAAPAAAPAPAGSPFPSQSNNFTPRLVEPATGGTPVMAIPLGGNLYEPVTGGVPVPGTALTPP